MLFPRPREMDLTNAAGSATEVGAQVDASLPRQGYELAIEPEGTRIRHADEAGLRYARQTLAALAESGPVRRGRIRDWPDFPQRGFLLDVSRDRVPTLATLRWLIERLASLRYTHLQLYTEHTFAYAGHETVWRDASPITPAELRQLDRWCAEHGIELAATQNTFGHMDRWLRHPDYRDRAECPDGSEAAPGFRAPPWSLEPTPDNAAFALGLVREMAGCLRSRRVNICADEPFDLGLGRSRAQVERHGRAAVFVEHLRRLSDPLIAEGHDVLFWGDGLVRHPELVGRLPRDGATVLVWRYDAPDPDGPAPEVLAGPELAELLGLPEGTNRGFAAFVAPFATAGYPFWVAPGTSSWNSFVGRWSNARANLLDAASTGLDAGAAGYLVTDWGDNGHPQPLPVSLPAAAYGAGVAWGAAANRDADVGPVVDRLLEADAGTGDLLTDLGDLYRAVGTQTVNGSPLMLAVLAAPPTPVWGRPDPAGCDAAGDVLAAALDRFAAVPFRGPRAATTAAELVAACRLARHGLRRLRAHPDPDGRSAADDRDLVADFLETVALQRAAWLAGSRPGGLDDSLARLSPPRPL